MDLSNLNVTDDIEVTGDSLPAVRSWAQESGVYPVTVDMAYLLEGPSGSQQLMVHFKENTIDQFTLKHKFILTSGHAKGQKNYYMDQEKKKHLLPGMDTVMQMCQLATDKQLAELDVQNKMVPIYDFDARTEVPTSVPVVMDLLGSKLQIGILKITQNKRVNRNGSWEEGPDKQEINEVDKVFDEDGRSLVEHKTKTDPEFIERWKERNEGRTVNKFKPVAGATPGAPAPAPRAPSMPTKALFED